MSISCEGYIGYTITLKTNLTEKDFDFFHNASETIDFPDRVQLIIDGMCGNYARLICVDEVFECWVDGKEYFSLKGPQLNEEIYEKLNQVYKEMYHQELEREKIEYGLSFHFY